MWKDDKYDSIADIIATAKTVAEKWTTLSHLEFKEDTPMKFITS